MKISNTPIFNRKIKSAMRKIKREKIKAPSDGLIICLFDTYTRKGKWQIDYIHDTRRFPRPYVAAFYIDFDKDPFMATSVKYHQL